MIRIGLVSTYFLLTFGSSVLAQNVILFDEFKDNSNNWQQGKTAISDVRIIPGREMYMVNHKSKVTTEAWTAWTDVTIDEKRDFKISALLYKEGGVKNYGYGLLWGGREKNFYSFLVSPGGYYCVGKVVDGIWQDITPDGWIKSTLVEQGRKGSNRLALSKIGETYHFEINGQKVATMKCGPFYGNKLGFNVNNKQKIMIDWIKVEYLN